MGKIGYTTEEVDKLLSKIESLKQRKKESEQEIFQKTTIFRKWMPFHAEDGVTYFTNVIVCDKNSTTFTAYFRNNSRKYIDGNDGVRSNFFRCAHATMRGSIIQEKGYEGELGCEYDTHSEDTIIKCNFPQSVDARRVILLSHPLFITKRNGIYYLEDYSNKNDAFKDGRSVLGVEEATRILEKYIEHIRDNVPFKTIYKYRCSVLRLRGSKSIYGGEHGNKWTRSHPHSWRWTTRLTSNQGWDKFEDWVRRVYEGSLYDVTKIVRVQKASHNNSRWCYLILKKCRSGRIGVYPLRKK